MSQLTPSIKKSITNDWAALLPQFAVYKSMWLARRIGPLIQGICLDRDSSNSTYLPTLHVHCLCRPFQDLTFGLAQPLLSLRSGGRERVRLPFHDSKYRDALERLINSSILPTEGDWNLSQLLGAYEKYRFLGREDSLYPVNLMEDAISVCAWLGELSESQVLIESYINEAKKWPADVLTRGGGIMGLNEKLNLLAVSGDLLRKNVNEQIELLKLGQLPESQLLIS